LRPTDLTEAQLRILLRLELQGPIHEHDPEVEPMRRHLPPLTRGDLVEWSNYMRTTCRLRLTVKGRALLEHFREKVT
jgi:hypothetical protein